MRCFIFLSLVFCKTRLAALLFAAASKMHIYMSKCCLFTFVKKFLFAVNFFFGFDIVDVILLVRGLSAIVGKSCIYIHSSLYGCIPLTWWTILLPNTNLHLVITGGAFKFSNDLVPRFSHLIVQRIHEALSSFPLSSSVVQFGSSHSCRPRLCTLGTWREKKWECPTKIITLSLT